MRQYHPIWKTGTGLIYNNFNIQLSQFKTAQTVEQKRWHFISALFVSNFDEILLCLKIIRYPVFLFILSNKSTCSVDKDKETSSCNNNTYYKMLYDSTACTYVYVSINIEYVVTLITRIHNVCFLFRHFSTNSIFTLFTSRIFYK